MQDEKRATLIQYQVAEEEQEAKTVVKEVEKIEKVKEVEKVEEVEEVKEEVAVEAEESAPRRGGRVTRSRAAASDFN